MDLYIGGRAQGKLTYVLQKTGVPLGNVYDAAEAAPGCALAETKILNHFHILVKTLLQSGENPEEVTRNLLSTNPGLILISDEVGNGIVPVDAGEREYRERLGRILCDLAEKAEKVERVLCGIGQKIK